MRTWPSSTLPRNDLGEGIGMAAALMCTLCRREVRSCKGNCRCFGEGSTCRDFLMVYQMGGGTNWQQQPNRMGRHSQLDNMMIACLPQKRRRNSSWWSAGTSLCWPTLVNEKSTSSPGERTGLFDASHINRNVVSSKRLFPHIRHSTWMATYSTKDRHEFRRIACMMFKLCLLV